jgi:DNA-binding beta-propeller fold protein YncE
MKVMWKAVCAVVFCIAAATIEIGCGDVYRPVAAPAPVITGNPSGTETESVLNQCPSGSVCVAANGTTTGSTLTAISVDGDTNSGNKPLTNQVGGAAGPVTGSVVSPFAFDYSRTVAFTANTATDSVTEVPLNLTSGGFSANLATISLPAGSQPINISFQYFGATYTQDYVVNSGTKTANCPGTGSLGVITQASAELTATVCVGVKPVAAWIYRDQSKVFVLDNSENQVYVVSATQFKWTNKIPVGDAPFKAAQSSNGNYLYVLNAGGSISVIDGQAEAVVATVSTSNPLTSSPPIDIAQDPNYNDTSANKQVNHIWILHADGTVSVWDGTTPGQLTWITSLPTITAAQAASGAYPTNLALMRDGTQAYVGVGKTDQVIAIDTSKLAEAGIVTLGVNSCPSTLTCSLIPATTSITVGVHRTVTQTVGSVVETLETTTPKVSEVAVSRQGNSADLSKMYAATTTTTTYNYYDTSGILTSSATYANLYNGTAVTTAAANESVPINTYVTTIAAPSVVTYCDPGNPATGEYDGQKNCPAMIPVMVLGRS